MKYERELTLWLRHRARTLKSSSEIGTYPARASARWWTIRLVQKGRTVSVGYGPTEIRAMEDAWESLPEKRRRWQP